MFHIILYEPEIPQNTGNAGRLAAITNSRLHLIHPLGFKVTDKNLRRAGMDYWFSLDVHEHENWQAFKESGLGPERIFLLTTKATTPHWDAPFQDGDGLLFGKESAGCPLWLHEEVGDEFRITIPQPNPEMRSINLSTSVGIVTYEALRRVRKPYSTKS